MWRGGGGCGRVEESCGKVEDSCGGVEKGFLSLWSGGKQFIFGGSLQVEL